jgi:LysM domain
MAKLTRYLTSIAWRSSRPRRHRLVALALAALLILASTLPSFAVAGESDSEGEGTAPPIEVPVGPPDFDPGGEETELEDSDAEGDEESGGAVEVEAEVEVEPPAPAEPPAAPDPPVEPSPAAPLLPASAPAPDPEPAQPPPSPEVPETANRPEPVANQAIKAPRPERKAAGYSAASDPGSSVVGGGGGEVPPTEEEAPVTPTSSEPAPPAQKGRKLVGKNFYVVQPGDCLSYIAAALLPPGSDTEAIEDKVDELWQMNEARIGTGDPDLIYVGTVLRVR